MTSTALMFYSAGMLALAFCELLNKSFFAMHDSKTPMKTSVIGMVCNIGLSVALSRVMGFGGLALATALSSVVNAVALLICMRRASGKDFFAKRVEEFRENFTRGRSDGGGRFCSVSNCRGDSLCETLALPVLCAVLGAVVYFIVCSLLNVEELQMVWEIILKKKKGGQHESE